MVTVWRHPQMIWTTKHSFKRRQDKLPFLSFKIINSLDLSNYGHLVSSFHRRYILQTYIYIYFFILKEPKWWHHSHKTEGNNSGKYSLISKLCPNLNKKFRILRFGPLTHCQHGCFIKLKVGKQIKAVKMFDHQGSYHTVYGSTKQLVKCVDFRVSAFIVPGLSNILAWPHLTCFSHTLRIL